MFDPQQDRDTVVISDPGPQVCGGTYATQNVNAPTVIESHEMVLLEATTALGGMVSPDPSLMPRFGYVSAFAAPAGSDTFLFLQTRPVYGFNEPDSVSFALVKENVFPELDLLVRVHHLSRGNGRHSNTSGLPQNFGGRVYVRYASGEQISFSNNQSPVLSPVAANEIADFFAKAIAGEKRPLPSADAIKEIRFSETRKDGGFARATLTLNADGTGTNRKAQCFTPGQVYESEKPVDAATIDAIKKTVARCGMFAWSDLPRSEFTLGDEKTMTFVLTDGQEITVTNQKALPSALSGGFFSIELELITKH